MFDLKFMRWATLSLRVTPKYTAVLLLLSACGGQPTHTAPLPSQGASSTPSPAAVASPAAEPTPSTLVTLQLADSRYGRIIVDGSGRALYLFDADRSEASTCYAACVTAWPPLIATQPPTAGPNLAQAL